jgi:hypothetical protein
MKLITVRTPQTMMPAGAMLFLKPAAPCGSGHAEGRPLPME